MFFRRFGARRNLFLFHHLDQVFEQADGELKKSEQKPERKMLLDAWLAFEKEHGTAATQARVQKLMPSQVKRRREIFDQDGVGWRRSWCSAAAVRRLKHQPPTISFLLLLLFLQTSEGWEEYWDYVYPDEKVAKPHFKLLQMAQNWKAQQQQQQQKDKDPDADGSAADNQQQDRDNNNRDEEDEPKSPEEGAAEDDQDSDRA